MNDELQKKVAAFFEQFKQQTYKKGDILIPADKNPSGIFYLTEGLVRMYTISQKGDEIVLNIYKPYAFFPMNWVINDTENIYYYEAISPVTVWKAPKEQVKEFIMQNSDVLYDLTSRLYKGLDGLLTRMTYLMTGNAYARLIIELIIHAKRFGKENASSQVAFHISERELATQAGLTRETVSREMKKLKEKGLVIKANNAHITIDLQKLESEL